jgi:hypothetical protein
LIQCSLAENSGNGAANKIRNMRKSNAKALLPLSQDDITKAKACEEMILFEKPGTDEDIIMANAPNGQAIEELKNALQ